jgi:hypothetical protein
MKPCPSKGKASLMRVPTSKQARYAGQWETIRYALDSNARTLRLCLIWFVVICSPAADAAFAGLLHHLL